MGSGLTGRTADDLTTYGKGQVVVHGSFAPNGGSDPAASSVKGSLVQSVTRSAAGRWLVTLRIPVKDVISETLGRREVANNVKSDLQFGAFSNVGTGSKCTFIVRNLIDGTETDPAGSPNADIRIAFQLVIQRGAVK